MCFALVYFLTLNDNISPTNGTKATSNYSTTQQQKHMNLIEQISQRLEMKGAIHYHFSSVKMKCSKTNNYLNFSVHDLKFIKNKKCAMT